MSNPNKPKLPSERILGRFRAVSKPAEDWSVYYIAKVVESLLVYLDEQHAAGQEEPKPVDGPDTRVCHHHRWTAACYECKREAEREAAPATPETGERAEPPFFRSIEPRTSAYGFPLAAPSPEPAPGSRVPHYPDAPIAAPPAPVAGEALTGLVNRIKSALPSANARAEALEKQLASEQAAHEVTRGHVNALSKKVTESIEARAVAHSFHLQEKRRIALGQLTGYDNLLRSWCCAVCNRLLDGARRCGCWERSPEGTNLPASPSEPAPVAPTDLCRCSWPAPPLGPRHSVECPMFRAAAPIAEPGAKDLCECGHKESGT